jgi:FixJ family two-component response regulator
MARAAVYIVDDDAAVRDSMAQLLAMHGYETRQFPDAAGYLGEAENLPKGCLLLADSRQNKKILKA